MRHLEVTFWKCENRIEAKFNEILIRKLWYTKKESIISVENKI